MQTVLPTPPPSGSQLGWTVARLTVRLADEEVNGIVVGDVGLPDAERHDLVAVARRHELIEVLRDRPHPGLAAEAARTCQPPCKEEMEKQKMRTKPKANGTGCSHHMGQLWWPK